MDLKGINNGPFNQFFYAALFRIMTRGYFRRWFKHSQGVLFVSPRLCIKSKRSTTLAEAQAMLFISQNTTIPVPKIYSAFEHKGRVYIVMERIRGRDLAYGWTQRSKESQSKLLQELKSMIDQIRCIPPSITFGVANVCGGPIYDQRLPNKSTWGPFQTIQDFHKELRNGIEVENLSNDKTLYPRMRELIAFHNQSWPTPVFTHGDLSSFNILAQDNKIIGIIDWETAGWMPPYWEYTSAWHVNPQNEFWREEITKFLTPMPYERDMEAIRRQYFGDF